MLDSFVLKAPKDHSMWVAHNEERVAPDIHPVPLHPSSMYILVHLVKGFKHFQNKDAQTSTQIQIYQNMKWNKPKQNTNKMSMSL